MFNEQSNLFYFNLILQTLSVIWAVTFIKITKQKENIVETSDFLSILRNLTLQNCLIISSSAFRNTFLSKFCFYPCHQQFEIFCNRIQYVRNKPISFHNQLYEISICFNIFHLLYVKQDHLFFSCFTVITNVVKIILFSQNLN